MNPAELQILVSRLASVADEMALILPKGIVVNSDKINESVQKIAQEPLDTAEIAKFWKGTAIP